jgi:DNA gyrase subunit A
MQLLTVTANGFGKRTPFEEYPRHHRGGGGVITHQVTDKTGPVVAARTVNGRQELMIISASGIILRTRIDSIPPVGRSTQGVHLMGVGPGDSVASISCFDVGQVSGKTRQAGAAKRGAETQEGDDRKASTKAMAKKGDAKTPPAKAAGKAAPTKGKKQT